MAVFSPFSAMGGAISYTTVMSAQKKLTLVEIMFFFLPPTAIVAAF
jgi:hypothetical protein